MQQNSFGKNKSCLKWLPFYRRKEISLGLDTKNNIHLLHMSPTNYVIHTAHVIQISYSVSFQCMLQISMAFKQRAPFTPCIWSAHLRTAEKTSSIATRSAWPPRLWDVDAKGRSSFSAACPQWRPVSSDFGVFIYSTGKVVDGMGT